MTQGSLTMFWLNFRSRYAVNSRRGAGFRGSEHPFRSNISPLCVLPLLKMKREPNIFSILYIEMTEGSSTMFWLNFRSRQAVNRCRYAFWGGSDHPFWVRYQYIVCVSIVENETRAQHSLYIIYRHDGMQFDHALARFQVTTGRQ